MEIRKTLLCIDSNHDTCELVTALFADAGYTVETARAGDEGLELLMNRKYSAVVLGFFLPGRKGPSVCRKFREIDGRTPVVFYTEASSVAEREEGIEAGAQAYLINPDDQERLVTTVDSLVEPVPAVFTPPQRDTEGSATAA